MPGITPNIRISDRKARTFLSTCLRNLQFAKFSLRCSLLLVLGRDICSFCPLKSTNSEFGGQDVFRNSLTEKGEDAVTQEDVHIVGYLLLERRDSSVRVCGCESHSTSHLQRIVYEMYIGIYVWNVCMCLCVYVCNLCVDACMCVYVSIYALTYVDYVFV
jgi:hypothetical protein